VRGVGKTRVNSKQQQETKMKKLIPLLVAMASLPAMSVCAADAKALYEKDCAKCHGADGKGDTRMGKKLGAKDYSNPNVQAALKDDAAFKAIKEGLKGKEDNTLMKPIEGASDDDIKALVGYMRTFKK
jgi:cytochrome c553